MVSPQLLYMSTFFQIVTCLVDHNNIVNIGKFIKRFPFEKLCNFIESCGECWFLKRNIRATLNRIFYFSTGTNAYIMMILKHEIPSIIKDLDAYIRIKIQKGA